MNSEENEGEFRQMADDIEKSIESFGDVGSGDMEEWLAVHPQGKIYVDTRTGRVTGGSVDRNRQ